VVELVSSAQINENPAAGIGDEGVANDVDLGATWTWGGAENVPGCRGIGAARTGRGHARWTVWRDETASWRQPSRACVS